MEILEHLSSFSKPWGKSFTPKRYLHPPFSENIVTMWPNMGMVIGEIAGGAEPQQNSVGKIAESKLPSCAVYFLYNEQIPDYKAAEYKTRDDGLPIHTVAHRMEGFCMEVESFCNTKRVSTVFARATITNISNKKIRDMVTIVSRTGPEFDLLGICEPDGYTRSEPSLHRIKLLPRWNHQNGYMTDGEYTLRYKADEKTEIVDSDSFTNNFTDKDGIYFVFELEPGESTAIEIAFGRDRSLDTFVYEDEKQKTVDFWENELCAIQEFPNKNDPFTYKMFRSLVVQGLQMFNYPQNCDYVIMRQGGLQRRMWPTENRSMIEALSRIGNFEKYHDAIFDTYFNTLQAENGEIENFGIHWASITGAVLFSFSVAAKKHPELYRKYKDGAYKAFLWIESQIEKAKQDPLQTPGLFPTDQDSDYPAVAQVWTQTDMWYMSSYEKFAEVLEMYDDCHFAEVKRRADQYRLLLTDIFKRFASEQEESDVLVLPRDPKNDPELEERLKKAHPHHGQFGPYILLFNGIAGYGTKEAEKLLRYFLEVLNDKENGLVLPFPEVNITSRGTQWYLNWLEYKLYFYYMRSGKKDLARDMLSAQIKYGMTNECYMSERYDDHDAYFTPWCPNCSASGRTILMLCDWYSGNNGEL